MDNISSTIRLQVAGRAEHQCEYCQTVQRISGAQMVIDHILPRAKDGSSDIENLCYACSWCNSYKWSRTTGIDPQTKLKAPLYNPRIQNWNDHFCWSEDGLQIIGLTPTGRVTVETLKMNNEYCGA